jgi:hypothetical protein
MRRALLPALVPLAAAALVTLLAFGVSHEGTSSSIDGRVARGILPPAPDQYVRLSVLGLSSSRSLADFVVLNIFASWCENCAPEASILNAEQRRLSRDGGTVVGVTYLDNSVDSTQLVKNHQISAARH